MNNRGQALVIFVIVLPLLFIIGVFIFDLSTVYTERSKVENIAYDALYKQYTAHHDMQAATSYVRANDSAIVITEHTDKSLCVYKDVDVIFGSVLGKDKYTIKTCYDAKVNVGGVLGIDKRDD